MTFTEIFSKVLQFVNEHPVIVSIGIIIGLVIAFVIHLLTYDPLDKYR